MNNTLSVENFLKLYDNAKLTIVNCQSLDDSRFVYIQDIHGHTSIINDNNYQNYYNKRVCLLIRLSIRFIHNLFLTSQREINNSEDLERYVSYGMRVCEPNSIFPINMDKKLKKKRIFDHMNEIDYDNLSHLLRNDKNELIPYFVNNEFKKLLLNNNHKIYEEKWYSETLNLSKYLSVRFPFIDIYKKVSNENKFPPTIKTSEFILYQISSPRLFKYELSKYSYDYGIHSKSCPISTGNNVTYYIRYKKEYCYDSLETHRFLKLHNLKFMSSNIPTIARCYRFEKNETVAKDIRDFSDTHYYIAMIRYFYSVYPDLTMNDLQYLHNSLISIKSPSPYKVVRNLTCEKLKNRVLYLHNRNMIHMRDGVRIYGGNWHIYF